MLRRPIEHHSLKPFVFPPGFKLLQDTREQLPLFPENAIPVGLQIENRCLKDGDYSVVGLEHMIVFERKQISDAMTYVGKDRAKTVVKMERFREIRNRGGFVGLVVEATEQDLFNGYHMSNVPCEVVRQTLVSFEVRYGVHCYLSRSREDIARWLLDRAIKAYRMWYDGVQEQFGSLGKMKTKRR